MASSYPASHLLDPRAMKQHLQNGNPAFHFQSSHNSASSSKPSSSQTTPEPFQKSSIHNTCDHTHVSTKGRSNAPPTPRLGTPQQLLDPKRSIASKHNTKPVKMSENGSVETAIRSNAPSVSDMSISIDHEANETQDQGAGSLIERLHNVSEREQPPAKKPKLDRRNDEDVEFKKKGSTASYNNGGDLGTYITGKQKEGLQQGPADVVDLTGTTTLWFYVLQSFYSTDLL